MKYPHQPLTVSACLLAMALDCYAEDARFFANQVEGLSQLEFFYTRTNSGTSSDDQLPLVGISAKFDTATLHYRHYLNMGDQTAFWSVQVPSVEIKAADENDPFGDTRETGVGDPTLQLAGHFYGRPVLERGDWDNWQEHAALGWSIATTLPLGEYDNTALVNAGNNRWVAQAQLHATQATRMGLLEASLAFTQFGRNDEFWGAWQLQQQPLWQLNAYVSHDITSGSWWWWGARAYYGGRSQVHDVPCLRARDYEVSCVDGELVDHVDFSAEQKDWRAVVGVHIEWNDDVLDIVLQRLINDSSGEHSVEIGKVAYSTRW